jgi:hypothetical protein
VSIIKTEEYGCESLESLLKTLVLCNDSAATRVCLLICPQAKGPKDVGKASIVDLAGPLLRAEVEHHLQARRGYNSKQSSALYERMLKLGLTAYPALIYTYIEDHCTH